MSSQKKSFAGANNVKVGGLILRKHTDWCKVSERTDFFNRTLSNGTLIVGQFPRNLNLHKSWPWYLHTVSTVITSLASVKSVLITLRICPSSSSEPKQISQSPFSLTLIQTDMRSSSTYLARNQNINDQSKESRSFQHVWRYACNKVLQYLLKRWLLQYDYWVLCWIIQRKADVSTIPPWNTFKNGAVIRNTFQGTENGKKTYSR